ncbi:MAG: type II toxin-antitoxin system HicB family antitoxin [Thermodesulfobacteriota bacterium]
MDLTYPIVLVQEGERWWAYTPDLPGVYGLGGSEAEAKSDIASALELYSEDLREEGKTLPASQVKRLETDHVKVKIPG